MSGEKDIILQHELRVFKQTQWCAHTTVDKSESVETQEVLLRSPVSSSRFWRFLAVIAFMASSMVRVSLLLATGTGRENGKCGE